ncbi:MAG: tail fiber domain-containing protein [Bacteroidales bacterium]|nr:tail fiber domain-containing protein [Candidatus Latescibacterota bacterium]
MKRLVMVVMILMMASSMADASSSVPRLISYQGVVRDSGGVVVPDDDYDITFRIYNVVSGGTALWTEAQTIAIDGGILNAILGSQTGLALDFDVQYWLGVEIGTEGEMTPRMLLTSSPYALRAAVADSVVGMGSGPGDITSVNAGIGLGGGGTSGDVTLFIVALPGSGILADPVDGISLEPGGVTTDKLAAEAVTNEKLSSDAVASANLMNNAVTNDKLGSGSVTSAKIAADAVGSANIQSSSITSGKLASDAVLSSNILNSAVTTSKLGDLSVSSIKIEGDAVTSAKILDGTVAFGDIGQNSAIIGQVMKWNGSAWVAADDIQGSGTIAGVYGRDGLEGGGSSGTVFLEIADDSVTTAKLGDDAVTTTKLSDGAVTSAKILDGTVAFGDIGQNGASIGQVMKWSGSAWAAAEDYDGGGTITGVYGISGLEGGGASGDVYLSIADNSVTTSKLGDGAVTGAKLGSDAVTTGKIQDGTILFDDIADNGASSGQIMKFNGISWIAGEDLDSGGGGGGGWVDDGITVRLEMATDSVGIGTTTPMARLHVVGNVIGEGSAKFGPGGMIGLYAFTAGAYNTANGNYSTVGGGSQNGANGDYSVIGGGYQNTVENEGGFIGGGRYNISSGEYSVVCGGGSETPGDENKAYGDYSSIGGGRNNRAGRDSDPSGDHEGAVIGGGKGNRTDGIFSTIGGGENNTTEQDYSTISGGRDNNAENFSVVGGGMNNDARTSSTIGGGDNNRTEHGGTVAGGSQNLALGDHSAIPGGRENTAVGNNSIAMGVLAKATHDGSIVICASDAFSSDDSVWTDQDEQLVIRADNGIYLTNISEQAQTVPGRFINTSTGGYLSTSGNWMDLSDREMKENFTEIDGNEILEKVSSLPITRWNYKVDGAGVEHIGPVSQDFSRIFGLGNDERAISTLDEAGISLAAIQELYRKAVAQETEIDDLKAQIEHLKDLVEKVLREED